MTLEERDESGREPEGEAGQEPEDGAAEEPEAGAAEEPEDGAAEEPEAGAEPEADADQEPQAGPDDAETGGEQDGEQDGPQAGPEQEGPDEPEAGAESNGPDEPEEAGDEPEEADDEPAEDGATEPARERPKERRRDQKEEGRGEDVIPGAHLEPDLVLAEERPTEAGFGEAAEAEVAAAEQALAEEEPGSAQEQPPEAQPAEPRVLDLAADARYAATGKRKRAVARVILRPGGGSYMINTRHLDEYFPRVRLQRMARQPLEAAGYQNRMDVVARIHGGGVSAQATALRHGIARALVEADPTLRGELKRRGYLTRDPRVKERKKAGLKKARKRPQFSKR